MALPLYAITLFISAFILFLVQPIVGKIILPKLGGTPQVWNTCMVFFQMVLLAGYAYTHNASTRLSLRQQLLAHAVLLCLPLIVLLPFPFALGGHYAADGVTLNPHSLWGFLPDLGSNPIPSTLAVLFLYVALPFVVVATTAPLLQKWFAHTGHPAAKDPYFLYGASNLGSMLSLIVYPTLVEPYVSLQDQGWVYTIGYLALTVFVVCCAFLVWNSKDATVKLQPEPNLDTAPAMAPAAPSETTASPPPTPTPATAVKSGQPKHHKHGHKHHQFSADKPVSIASDDITFGRRFRWVMLAAVPSSLMLGITTHICTDLSPMPLFWLIPLILYLLSFILVFARWPVVWTESPHTYFVYAQPIFIWLMIMTDVWNLTSSPAFIGFAIFAHVMGFFTTTMVCHGELAKDRPSTKHLTEFYLWMSVGGMCGGIFNGLIAPIIFQYGLWEFPLAIFAAGLVRPQMSPVGLLDNWIASLFEGAPDQAAPKPGHKGHKPHAPVVRSVTANESLVRNLDFLWPVVILILAAVMAFAFSGLLGKLGDSTFPPRDGQRSEASTIFSTIIMFGIPLGLACLCLARPLRIGLGIGAILLIHMLYQNANDSGTLERGRSYFGAHAVKQSTQEIDWNGKNRVFTYNQLIHGHINHGMNFQPPPDKNDRGDPDKDLTRLATTYYHRDGPEGRVMEKFNWFPGKPNTYSADARLPVSLIASAFIDAGTNSVPMSMFVSAWSEPPFATVGLGTGTMASYGRVYQHVHFYEIDDKIRRLNLPDSTRFLGNWEEYQRVKKANPDPIYFNMLENAIQRGSSVQVLMGDARLRMALPYRNHYEGRYRDDKAKEPDVPETNPPGGGPENFYHMMVVDAFSSDAIPAHLLTKQAFEMYFKRLVYEGVLCVHTSNRFVDLPKVVAAVASAAEVYDDKGNKTTLKHMRGHDANEDHRRGHFTSEWVMVARETKFILKEGGDAAFQKAYNQALAEKPNSRREDYWSSVPIEPRYVWTDDYYNLLSVVRWR